MVPTVDGREPVCDGLYGVRRKPVIRIYDEAVGPISYGHSIIEGNVLPTVDLCQVLNFIRKESPAGPIA